MKKATKIFRSFMYELIGLALLITVAIVLFSVNQTSGLIALSAAVIYAIVLFFVYKTGKRTFFKSPDAIGVSQMISSMVEIMDSPVMIVNETNKIIWNNDEFLALPEVSQHHITSGAGRLFNGKVSYANLEAAYEQFTDFISVTTSGSFYEIRVFPLEFNNQKLFGTVWYSRDAHNKLQTDYNNSAVRVAYIIVDNTNDVGEEIQANLRFGSAKVNMLLTEWAKEFSAILIEYERDKYMMQFEQRYFDKMVESRFDIIDKVFDASLEDSTVPITISIGVSNNSGTLAEKQEAALAALDTAVKRGGALAVVISSEGDISYGGKNKAVQKQTRIRSRLCKELLFEQIPRSSNVIIMGHLHPDYDSLASNIGIAKLVQYFNRDYCIVTDVNDSNFSKISEYISDFPEYENVFVDAEYAQELLTPDTLVIITDASNPEVFAARGIYENASKVIVIDHHAMKSQLGSQVLQKSIIDPTASSASELVCEILELSMIKNILRTEEAQVLISGILLDTQFFSRDTGTRTYSACVFLKNAGADAGKVKNLFKSDLNEFRKINTIENNMEIYHNNLIISIYTEDDDPSNRVAASKAANSFIEIEGISASFVLYLQSDGINISARSDGTINVGNIAKEIGGGGHFQSAGGLVKDLSEENSSKVIIDPNVAIQKLKVAIDKYFAPTKEG